MMAQISYAVCALTSLLCFFLLIKAYCQRRDGLLLWWSLGFFFFALQNALLFVDLAIVTGTSLILYRSLCGFVGSTLMLIAFIWRTSDAR